MKDHIDNLEIIQSYPLFKANQVLRENQLNDIVKYLEQQDRLSRICLMGTGIVCGLEAHWNAENSVLVVSPGTGVTSEGYLVKCDGKSFPAYKSIKLNLKWFGAGEKTLETGLEDNSDLQVWELDRKIEEDEDQEELNEELLTGKVLVLVLESQMDEGQGLCGNDCDEKGISRNFLTHYLLMDKNIADGILLATYDPSGTTSDGTFSNMNELFYFKFSALHPVIERFGFNNAKNENTAKLNDISSYDEFIRRYKLIISNLSKRLDEVFSEVNKIFSPVFVPNLISGDKLLEEKSIASKIETALGNKYHELNIQYVHDYLCDLVHAYGELMESVYELVADCPPNTQRYPKFLWIKGFQVVGDGPFSKYRTPYTQPPVFNGNQSRVSEANTLFKKLKLLANEDVFRVPNNRDLEIRITPSKSDKYPLSQRAVPFYYKNSEQVVNNWSPKLKRLGRAGNIYNYFRMDESPYNEPLIYRMEGCDFLRIEGHIGMPSDKVVERLTDLRQCYNLSFEMVQLKIGKEFDDDLFQFMCKDMDCERKQYQEQYTKLREVLVRHFSNGDYSQEILKILPEDIRDFGYVAFSERYVKMHHGQSQAGLPSVEDFEEIDKCYKDFTERWERAKNKHLFHHFALDHPGMQHRGGVPMGGTFVLAYVDNSQLQAEQIISRISLDTSLGNTIRENRDLLIQEFSNSRTVVADFYLPYSCVSGCVPTSIIAERPRPVLRVSPAVFCEGESNPTELEIRVQPEGGIITGPGYTFDQGRHLFTPSDSGISDGTVELKYYIDGGEATYHLTIIKLPEVGFTILNVNGNQTSEICQNGGLLTLALAEGASGGQFTVWHGDEELTEHLTLGDYGNYLMDPMAFPVGAEEPLLLLVRYSVDGNLCGNELARELTIHPLPDATFSFEGNVNEVCREEQRIEILPNKQGGDFSAHLENRPLPNVIIREGGKWFVNLSSINRTNQQSIQLRVRHTISTEFDCENFAERNLTIWYMPKADFNLPEAACQTEGAIDLNPQPVGGAFEYRLVESEYVYENLIQDNQFFPNRIEAEEMVVIMVSYSVSRGPCSGSTTKTIEIHPATQVNFQAQFVSRVGEPNAPFAVSFEDVDPANIQGEYMWNSNSGALSKILNHSFGKIPPQAPVSFEQDFEGELWVELSVSGEICRSEPIQKPVLPAIDTLTIFIDFEGEREFERPLENNVQIERSFFREQRFSIRATTLPFYIKGVSFELESDGEQIANLESELNELGNGYEIINVSEPSVGNYILKATPIIDSEIASTKIKGRTIDIGFRIIDDKPISRTDRELTTENLTFLRRRDKIYADEMENLSSDGNLTKTTSFQKTEAFLHVQADSDNFEMQYFDLVDTLERAAKRTEKGSTRQEEVFKLMEIATKHFMDREVVKSLDDLNVEVVEGLVSKIESMEEMGFNREALTANWLGKSLKEELNAPSAELLEKALISKKD